MAKAKTAVRAHRYSTAEDYAKGLQALGACLKQMVESVGGQLAETDPVPVKWSTMTISPLTAATKLATSVRPGVVLGHRSDGTPIVGTESHPMGFTVLNAACRAAGLGKVQVKGKRGDVIYSPGHAPADADWTSRNAARDKAMADAPF